MAKSFEREKSFRITEVRTRECSVMVRFDAPSVDLVEKLGQDLGKDLGFEPQIRSTLSGGGVNAELTLETNS
ncbi:MAG: hypothetical protein R3E95_02320 [Thiolinea sp.]